MKQQRTKYVHNYNKCIIEITESNRLQTQQPHTTYYINTLCTCKLAKQASANAGREKAGCRELHDLKQDLKFYL